MVREVVEPQKLAPKRAAKPNSRYASEEDEDAPQKKVQSSMDTKLWETRKLEQLQRSNQELRQENERLKKENIKLKDMVIDTIPHMSEMLTSWTQTHPNETPGQQGGGISVAAMTPGQQGSTAAGISVAAMTPEQSQPSEPTQVEIGKNTHILCNKNAWKAAVHASTATAMVRTLLLGVFPVDVLLQSNLKGGKSRRDETDLQWEALDSNTISVIFDAVLKKFPQATKGQLGTAVNSKIAELRFKTK